MELCVCTDEISQDVQYAIRAGRGYGIDCFSLRTIFGKRFPFWDEEDFSLLCALQKESSFATASITLGVYKSGLEQTPWEQLKQTGYAELFRLAEALQYASFLIYGGPLDANETEYRYMIDNIRKFGLRAAGRGCTTMLGNSTSSYCSTIKQLMAVHRNVGIPAMGISWDLCSGHCEGVLHMERDFKEISGLVQNIRLTDVKSTADGEFEFVPVGCGELDWQLLFHLLKKQGFQGRLTIETRCLNAEEALFKSVDYVRQLMTTAGISE